ncbi:MAG: YggS family pyridoxal phosphate-dependent enzyme [Clostridia bacterium]|nr:YggS family pyridoxal phosphate-dependent enzyme [Clostridia bacterium]
MMANWSADEQLVRDNLKRIEERLSEACLKAGRKREEVTLMAVTKTVSPERINAALSAGITCIGENRVQEFLAKKDSLQLEGVQKHLIGHLQTNKVRRIVGEVDMIQSVDSVHLAEAISKAAQNTEKGMIDVLVEVNIGGEESKSGIAPEQLDELLSEISGFSGIRVRGLMAIPPILTEETKKRAIFSQMRKLFIDIRGKFVDNVSMDILSMGMSLDYVEAVLEGSTMVRIGSSLFGERHYQ